MDGLATQRSGVLSIHQLGHRRLACQQRRIWRQVDGRVKLEAKHHMLAWHRVELEALGQLRGELLAKRLEHRWQRGSIDLLPRLSLVAPTDELHALSDCFVAQATQCQVRHTQVKALAVAFALVLAEQGHLFRAIEKTLEDVVVAPVNIG